MRIRLLLFLFIIMFPWLHLEAQQEHRIDSLTRELKKAKKPATRFKLYQDLSLLSGQKDKYKNRMLLNAELSRDADLQFRTYRFVAGLSIDSAQFYINKMAVLAKAQKNAEFEGWYFLYNGGLHFFIKNNAAKGLGMIQEANAIAINNDLDSLALEVNRIMGFIHNSKGERLLEYKSYMQQLALAEKIDDGRVAMTTYLNMFWFYNSLKHFSKAKEYALKILETGQQKKWPDWIESGNHLLTHYYTNVGEFETAKYYYEKTKKLRKQNHSSVTEDDDLLDIYLNANDYLNTLRLLQKDDIKSGYFKGVTGTPYDYYGLLANCYTKLGIKDSAFLGLKNMRAAMGPNDTNTWRYYTYLGNYYKLDGNADSVAFYYEKADSGIGYANNVEAHIERYANLDTLFSRKGNFQKAYRYKTLWMQYKDSAAALSKDGDLVVMEIENENQRMAAETRASHNIQYLGITAGLASVFILLVLLGVFSSGTTIIRGLGFFAFIFFFEFLVLLFDNAIHKLTHGEPWKILSIKIVLIAMLLPLHHYIEHKVVYHLLHRKKLTLLRWKKAKPSAPEALQGTVDKIAENFP